MNMEELKIWVLLGVVPFELYRIHLPDNRRQFVARALFWSFEMTIKRSGSIDWKLRVSLIEKLRQAVWAAVMHIRESKLETSMIVPKASKTTD